MPKLISIAVESLRDDGKRHRCHKPEKHLDAVHACPCSLEWKQF